MNDAPRGEVKITVFVPQAPPGGPAGMKFSPGGKSAGGIMGDMPAYIVQIPEKYNSVQTSGLSFTVKGGEQTHDIELTP
jgi:hypothetical protein